MSSFSLGQVRKVVVGVWQGALRIHFVLAQGLALFALAWLGAVWFRRHDAAVEGGDSIQLALSVFVDLGQVLEIADIAQVLNLLHILLEAFLLCLFNEHLNFVLVFETIRILLPLRSLTRLASVLASDVIVLKHF